MVLESIKKYNSNNKVRVEKIRCKKCGSENITGFGIGFGDYFNIITGLLEDYDGMSFNDHKNLPKYNVHIFKDNILEDFIEVECRDERDFCETEIIFSDGTKIDTSMENFKEIILYLLDNQAIGFSYE